MADKETSVNTLKELAKMYHSQEAKAITDDELWHTNGVFMKGVTTRKDLFIRAIQSARNDLVTMRFFAVLYGVMELSYREKGIYVTDTLILEEFCKTELGMQADQISEICSSYTMSTGYGFEITEEMFIDSVDRLSKMKKQNC